MKEGKRGGGEYRKSNKQGRGENRTLGREGGDEKGGNGEHKHTFLLAAYSWDRFLPPVFDFIYFCADISLPGGLYACSSFLGELRFSTAIETSLVRRGRVGGRRPRAYALR